jgi:gamma-glutamyltranspeptidase
MIAIVAGLGFSLHCVRADSETFTKHVVVAQEAHAAEAGRDVMRRGGNAIDA